MVKLIRWAPLLMAAAWFSVSAQAAPAANGSAKASPGSCGARPTDERRTQSCPSGTTGTWQQSRSYSSSSFPTCWTAGDWSPSSPPEGYCAPDVVAAKAAVDEPVMQAALASDRYTDLSSAPACAMVTSYPSKTVSSPSAAGIPVHAGRCLEATPSTIRSVWASVRPGDVVYLRGGTYSERYGEGTWYQGGNFETYKKGTQKQPIAVVAYPGETVVLRPPSRAALIFGDGSRNRNRAEFLTFAGFKIQAQSSCVFGGGDTTNSSGGPTETGGRYIRLVNIECTISDATSNTMTGMVSVQNDGWKIYGMTFRDPSNRTVIKNNHAIYIQGGADFVEVAYNKFINLHMGHVIQVHQDGTPKQHDKLNLHDNEFQALKHGDMRGISVINIADASTVIVASNKFRNLGQGGWGCLNFYRGNINAINNDCQNTQGGMNLNGGYGGTRRVTASYNRICPVSGYSRTTFQGGASSSQLSETNIRSCN